MGVGIALATVVPLPSCPVALLPQQYARPSVLTPQTRPSPADMRRKSKSPPTRCGTPKITEFGASVESAGSRPQQKAAPSAVSPQANPLPTVSETNRSSPCDRVGSAKPSPQQ